MTEYESNLQCSAYSVLTHSAAAPVAAAAAAGGGIPEALAAFDVLIEGDRALTESRLHIFSPLEDSQYSTVRLQGQCDG